MRKLATTVVERVSRSLLSNPLQSPPTWYLPVLTNLPSATPPVRSRPRPALHEDSSSWSSDRHGKPTAQYGSTKPRKVVYAVDAVRRQFYRDFPFEGFRPGTLIEGREVEVDRGLEGVEWTSLEQRGAYPTPESCIEFVMSLVQHHGLSRSRAYEKATKEFVALRARHEMATMAAELEARHYGAEFKLTAFERTFDRERRALDSLNPANRVQAVATRVKYKEPARWTSGLEHLGAAPAPTTEFTGGKGYFNKWRKARMPEEVQVDTPETVTVQAVEAPVEEEVDDGRVDELDFLTAALEAPSSSR